MSTIRASKQDEFRQLYEEFADDYPLTETGRGHIASYAENRQQGQENFREVEVAAEQGKDITDLVIQKFMPYAATQENQRRGVWIHHAPSTSGSLVRRMENAGRHIDWPQTTQAIFQFIKRCNDKPSELRQACREFDASEYSKGWQTGMLTPILNALRPQDFLLINDKSKSVINYFADTSYSSKIADYPVINNFGHSLIKDIAPTMRRVWSSPLSDEDQFDIFCHWLKSIKKYELSLTDYWMITPGVNSSQWQECLQAGFVSIGYDDLGNIAGLSRRQFNAQRDEFIAASNQRPRLTRPKVDQVWQFRGIKKGDHVIAVLKPTDAKVVTGILGIGKVDGNYYYDEDAKTNRHRLPVKWIDHHPQKVSKVWKSTLMSLPKSEFEEIYIASLANNEPPPASTKPTHPQCPFREITFTLLSKLHHNPHKAVYDAHKQDFKEHLEEPFQRLMLDVAAQLPAPIADLMETRSRIFARILKNDWGQGGAWDFYWGAFYPKGGKRTEDAQLFLWMSYERLECGFYIGQYGSEQRQRFLENCRTYQADLAERLQPTLDRTGIVFGSRADFAFRADGVAINRKGIGFSEWMQAPNDSDIHVAALLSREQVLSKSKAELGTFIRETYEQVFPLVLLATLEEPMAQLQEYLEPAEDVIETHPVYTLSQCAAATYLEEDLLHNWVDALKRKKQAILYGPPGTGKTFVAQHLTRHLLSGGDGFSALVQFHPAYTYEDFIQGIRPQQGKNGGLDYPIVSGRFLKFCEQARTRQGICVLIIDEINRANLAQVFGELMYLLEYRDQAVELASGKSFSIPENVRIIGTMNTADRSIALVDHALRRRFAFLPLYPDMEILRGYHAGSNFPIEKLIKLIEEVNKAIGDPQYEIGTSFFLDKDLEINLPAIWEMEIEPYLQEYFFDQTEKVKEFQWAKIRDRVMSS